MLDDVVRSVIGPLIGLAIAATSGGIVWILTRRTHSEKDVLHEQTLRLYEESNKELRVQNDEYRGKVDANTRQLAKLQADLAVTTEIATNRAAVAELATWGANAAAEGRIRDEAIQRELAGLRNDTAKWQAEEAKAREDGRRASAEEHRALVQAIDAMRVELGPGTKRTTRTQVRQVQVTE